MESGNLPSPATPVDHSAATAPVVIFDLDATLVAGDSMAAYLRTHLPRRPRSLMLSVLTVPLWAPALLSMRTRRAGQRLLIALVVHGRSSQELHASARIFAQDYIQRRQRAHPRGVAAARAHLQAGHRVLIATECWDVLAAALCTQMGLDARTGDHAEADTAVAPVGHQGSQTSRQRGDRREGDLSKGQSRAGVQVVAEDLAASGSSWRHLRVLAHYKDGKVMALQRAGVTFPVAAAYSDSLADLPLLTRAGMPHVVNVGRWQRHRFHRALGGFIPENWAAGPLPRS